ncbi:hypothetical protein [Curtanaerobium respiraculi]|uniref:hypothetical protein n=1 Tax=Curtanaerobium respiraculi TaxID=2949669 RepID=UPI0024B39555|nr:hypothetical protein [Curtanaerobium respiraculi]
MGHLAHRAMRKDEADSIAREWCVELYATPDSKVFEGDVSDTRFSNPVAYHIAQTSQDVVGYLFSNERDPEVPESVDDLCRLIALQEARPSEAFASFFKLRSIVFSRAGKSGMDAKTLSVVNDRIDACLLRAMDCYTRFREQIMQLRIDELKRSRGAFEGRYNAARVQVGA